MPNTPHKQTHIPLYFVNSKTVNKHKKIRPCKSLIVFKYFLDLFKNESFRPLLNEMGVNPQINKLIYSTIPICSL